MTDLRFITSSTSSSGSSGLVERVRVERNARPRRRRLPAFSRGPAPAAATDLAGGRRRCTGPGRAHRGCRLQPRAPPVLLERPGINRAQERPDRQYASAATAGGAARCLACAVDVEDWRTSARTRRPASTAAAVSN